MDFKDKDSESYRNNNFIFERISWVDRVMVQVESTWVEFNKVDLVGKYYKQTIYLISNN